MTSKQLSDLALRHQVFLEGLKVQTTQDFNKVYGQIEAKTRELLSALEVTNMQEASRVQVEATIRQLETASMTYGNGAIDQLALDMTNYAEYASEYEAASLGSVLRSKTPRAVGATAIMDEVFKQPVPLGNGQATLLEGMYSKLTTNEASRLGESIRNSWLRNDTVAQATRNVLGSKAAGYTDGILATSRRNAAAVVHTSLQHVSTSARFKTYEENDDLVIGYTWTSTLDQATSVQCRSLDGQRFIFKKGGYQPRPPIHVRCRSSTIPILNDGLDFLDKGATRSSREGYVDAKETYYDWLRRQSPEEQREILGAKRYELFSKGGLTNKQFAELNLDKNFQPMTLADMKAKNPAAFKKAEKARNAQLFSAPLSAEPKPGTTTAKVWGIADDLQKELGRMPTGVEVTKRAVEQGVNKAVAQSYYSGWKKERLGGGGVVPPPVVPPPVVPPPVIPSPGPKVVRVPSRDGIKPGTSTAGVFDVADEIYLRTGKIPTRAEVLAVTREKGMSDNVVDSYMVRWRKALKDIDKTGLDLVVPPGGISPAPVKVPGGVIKLPSKAEQWTALKDRLDGALNSATDPGGTITKEIERHKAKLQDLQQYPTAQFHSWRNPNGMGWKPGTPQHIIDGYKTYSEGWREATSKVDELTRKLNGSTAVDQAMLDVLRRPQGSRGSLLLKNTGSVNNPNMGKARETLEELIHPEFLKKVPPVGVAKDTKGRESYNPYSHIINVTNYTKHSTLVHELTHAIEDTNPELLKKTRVFLQKRAGGEQPEKLSKLTGHKVYDKYNERAYKDEWVSKGGSHYMGKVYTSGSEILTMGMERLIKSPAEFYKRDPEYFEFLIRAINDL